MKRPILALLFAVAGAASASAQTPDGKALFQTKCSICHSAAPTGGPVVGPNLYGVVGRKAGQAPGFKYSKALLATNAVWTAPVLDKYLANPQAFAPGAFMPIALPSPTERTAVIAYLGGLKPAAAAAPAKPAAKGKAKG